MAPTKRGAPLPDPARTPDMAQLGPKRGVRCGSDGVLGAPGARGGPHITTPYAHNMGCQAQAPSPLTHDNALPSGLPARPTRALLPPLQCGCSGQLGRAHSANTPAHARLFPGWWAS